MKGGVFIKKRIIKVLISFLAVVIICLSVITGGYIKIKIMESKLHPVTEPFSSMKRVQMCVDYIFPLSETEKCIGFSDYSFIGTVEEILGTEYDSLRYTWQGLIEETPTTYYRIKVKHNIKGNAPEEFTMVCSGGQQPNGMLENFCRTMPEKDSTYVFMCRNWEENICYFNCHRLGDKGWYESADNTDQIIKTYEEYYENQDLSVRLN